MVASTAYASLPLAALGLLAWSSAVVAAGPPPSAAQVEAAIQQQRPMSKLSWKFVRMSAARSASAGEAAHAGMPYPVTVYPVFVGFTETMGSSRDVTWHYYIYKGDGGDWLATSNAVPGNVEGPLH